MGSTLRAPSARAYRIAWSASMESGVSPSGGQPDPAEVMDRHVDRRVAGSDLLRSGERDGVARDVDRLLVPRGDDEAGDGARCLQRALRAVLGRHGGDRHAAARGAFHGDGSPLRQALCHPAETLRRPGGRQHARDPGEQRAAGEGDVREKERPHLHHRMADEPVFRLRAIFGGRLSAAASARARVRQGTCDPRNFRAERGVVAAVGMAPHRPGRAWRPAHEIQTG